MYDEPRIIFPQGLRTIIAVPFEEPISTWYSQNWKRKSLMIARVCFSKSSQVKPCCSVRICFARLRANTNKYLEIYPRRYWTRLIQSRMKKNGHVLHNLLSHVRPKQYIKCLNTTSGPGANLELMPASFLSDSKKNTKLSFINNEKELLPWKSQLFYWWIIISAAVRWHNAATYSVKRP